MTSFVFIMALCETLLYLVKLVFRYDITLRRKRGGGQGGHVPPPHFRVGGGQRYVCAPPPLSDPEFRGVPPPPILSRSYAVESYID